MRVTIEDKTAKVVIDPDDGVTKAEPWSGEGVAGVMVKSDSAKRYTLTMGYPANKADQGVALDGNIDFAGPDAIEKAAWDYMQNPEVGLWHDDGTTTGAGRVVESYIYRGPDWAIKAVNDSEVTIKAGDWLLGIVWGEETWPDVVEGRIGGTSMEGTAARRKPSPEAVEGLRS